MNIDEYERRITGSTWFDGCETVKSYISQYLLGGMPFCVVDDGHLRQASRYVHNISMHCSKNQR